MNTFHSNSLIAPKYVSQTTWKMAESVNNGGGNRPLEVFCPTFCSKQGQADQVAQGSMQGNCEHLHGGRLLLFVHLLWSVAKSRRQLSLQMLSRWEAWSCIGQSLGFSFCCVVPTLSPPISLKQIREVVLVSMFLHCLSVIRTSVKHMQPAQGIQWKSLQEERKRWRNTLVEPVRGSLESWTIRDSYY